MVDLRVVDREFTFGNTDPVIARKSIGTLADPPCSGRFQAALGEHDSESRWVSDGGGGRENCGKRRATVCEGDHRVVEGAWSGK